ncbi:MAG: winged helix-turn-helix transcriptional regulator [Deltaproteobacteria bacterium]|nr:winged helix-turn-helix transcriptional regulator [Deltaproteobacteria bacterium]MBW2531236.1 winged helix-turn-helix transcriptional regulator [Deltaproteobacteria bacterium]
MSVEISNKVLSHDQLVQIFKALSDSNRLAIFRMLRGGCAPGQGCDPEGPLARRTVSEIAERLEIGLPTVSHHLKELRRSGLVRTEKDGQRRRCSIDDSLLDEIATFFRAGDEPPACTNPS